MSTIISIKNDNSYQVLDRAFSSPRSDAGWYLIGKAMGYPDSWVAIIRQRLAKDGRSWSWNATGSTTVLQPPDEERSPALNEGGHALLIVNRRTPMRAIREALLLAERNNAELTVVYTSRPPLMDGSQTEREVDQKFTLELEKGRAFLGSIASEAKSFGVKTETTFVWAESSSDLLKQRHFDADLVLDETA